MENKTIWFWNKSANKTELNLENGRKLNEKPSFVKALLKTKEVVSI